MKILMTGSTGFVGKALCQDLQSAGHTVCRLVRPGTPAEMTRGAEGFDVHWNPATSELGGAAVGADAVVKTGVVNKTGTEPLAQAARRARVPAYVLADSSKWLPAGLERFWQMREEAPGEITRLRHSNVQVHNRYFDCSPLRLFTGVVWNEGIAAPSEVRRRIGRLGTSTDLIVLLEQQARRRRA